MTAQHPQANISQMEEDRRLVKAFLQNPAGRGALLQTRLQQGVEQGLHAAEKEFMLTLDKETRADLMSTAIMKALTGLPRWKGTASLHTWTHRIAYNTAVDALRKKRNDPLHEAVSIQTGETKEKNTSREETLQTRNDWEPENNCPETALIDFQKWKSFPRVRHIVDQWPEPERSLGYCILDGEADSISAAAHIVKAKLGTKLYPAKAKQALQARQKEFEGLGLL
jgi:RNA polymerase sigma factor (sigma-70 family)